MREERGSARKNIKTSSWETRERMEEGDRKRETERCRVEERDGKGERDLEEKIPIDLRQRKNKRKLECQRVMK